MKSKAPAPEEPSDIAAFIKEARIALKLTQEGMAFDYNCTKGNVSGWEKGRHEPPIATLIDLSKRSGVDLPGVINHLQSHSERAKVSRWPFSKFTQEQYESLKPEAKKYIDDWVADRIADSKPALPDKKISTTKKVAGAR